MSCSEVDSLISGLFSVHRNLRVLLIQIIGGQDMSTIDPLISGQAPGTASPPRSMAVGHAFRDMPFGSIHFKICAVLFIAFAIEAWEMLMLTYVAGDLATSLQVGMTQVGIAISALFLGMIPGSLIWGPISDRIGRKATCAWSFAGYGVFTLLSCFAPNFETLSVARFLAGLAFSGVFTVTFPYFEELLPVKVRGRATVYLAAGWPIGILAALGTAALIGGHGWRWVIAVSALASLWGIVLYRVVPESPYWLARQGRNEDAHDVLERLGARGISRGTIFTVSEGKKQSIWSLFKGRMGRITVIQVLINFTFSWGYWGLQSWMPTLLQGRGLSASSSFSFIALSAVLMIPGYMTASYLTGRFRPQMDIHDLRPRRGRRRFLLRDSRNRDRDVYRHVLSGLLRPGSLGCLGHVDGRALSLGHPWLRLRVRDFRSARRKYCRTESCRFPPSLRHRSHLDNSVYQHVLVCHGHPRPVLARNRRK